MKHPTFLTLGEASKLTGVSKSTISRALKTGKLSYVSNDSDGYKIDPAELSRVYDVKHYETPRGVPMKHFATPNATPMQHPHDGTNKDHELEILKLKLQQAEQQRDLYKEKAIEWKEQCDGWKKQANQLLLQSKPNNDHQSHQDKQQKIPKETVREIQKNAIIAYRKHLVELRKKQRLNIKRTVK